MTKPSFLFISSLFISSLSLADTSNIVGQYSLEYLLNIEIEVTGGKSNNIRESSGIISYITADEIRNMGARDLIDILRLVPGFEFGADVVGATGIGVRGNWAFEGKVLFLVDGLEMNETRFSNTPLGNRFPIDSISQIEIIRGPGSAIYGGFAELGVINIITKSADELYTSEVSVTTSRMKGIAGRSNLSISMGKVFSTVERSYSLSLYKGQGERSDDDFTDYFGETYNMEEHELMPLFVNFGFAWDGLKFRGIVERYDTRQRNGFFGHQTSSAKRVFDMDQFQIEYQWNLSDSVTIIPTINYKDQRPWNAPNAFEFGGADKTTALRIRKKVLLNWDIDEQQSIVSGIEEYSDISGGYSSRGETPEYDESTTSIFIQYSTDISLGNFTLGGRYEHQRSVGISIVPRFAWTKIWDKVHTKVLASKAFRTPTFDAISGDLTGPESATVFMGINYETNEKS